jgi:shikimate dehydrogenase
VAVVNRTARAAEATAELAASAGAIGLVGSFDDVRGADIVVNATSIGMGSNDLPCDPSLLHAGQVVADIVYHPRDTAFLQVARAVGAIAVDGLGMLVHQAALQQQLWHGALPDVGVMTSAAERELAARRQ